MTRAPTARPARITQAHVHRAATSTIDAPETHARAGGT